MLQNVDAISKKFKKMQKQGQVLGSTNTVHLIIIQLKLTGLILLLNNVIRNWKWEKGIHILMWFYKNKPKGQHLVLVNIWSGKAKNKLNKKLKKWVKENISFFFLIIFIVIRVDEKRTYLNELEFLAVNNPGPG